MRLEGFSVTKGKMREHRNQLSRVRERLPYNSKARETSVGQARKSARGMPRHQEPTKDVISCDKLRGAANER